MTVEMIMNRIKTTLTDAQKKRNYLKENKLIDTNKDLEHQLSKLTLEIEQNNRKWNINSEHAITSHRPIIGRFIILGKKVIRKLLRWYINPVIDQQRDFNASVTRSLNILTTLNINFSEELKALNEIEIKSKLQEELDFIENRMMKIENLTNQFEEKIKEFVSNMNHQIIETRDTLEQKIQDNFQNLSGNKNVTIDYFEQVSHETENKFQIVQNQVEQMEDALMLMNSRIRKRINTPAQTTNIVEDVNKVNDIQHIEQNNIEIDYFLFEQKFRGTRSAIIERQRFYLPFFIKKKSILDIGCGRGEFIELLGENGTRVKGIDLNRDMVDYCKERGFDVDLENALHYLHNCENNSLDAIFMAQVIEHLSHQESLLLLDSMFRVLEPGGMVVIETINVQSVFAMNNWFYLDPTHVKPVHPVTLKFILQGIGFSKVDIKYLSPVEGKGIPPLIIEGVNTDSFNNSMGDLSGLIYGFQDYAIFAYK
ncbi:MULTISPECIES: class I SAM-dependent methyltransferase [unclassified Paenibacillus]|uniref:class I SAM-dependent methyltransferase n=1 Tax=unclassified Paenibacillus TaxID=185978 RepID=UPI003636BE0B